MGQEIKSNLAQQLINKFDEHGNFIDLHGIAEAFIQDKNKSLLILDEFLIEQDQQTQHLNAILKEKEAEIAELKEQLNYRLHECQQYAFDEHLLQSTISEQQERIKEWISVEDRLPEKYCQCLIYCPNSFPKNSRVLAANYYDDDKLFYCDAFEQVHEDVTHWMPLPKSPESLTKKQD